MINKLETINLKKGNAMLQNNTKVKKQIEILITPDPESGIPSLFSDMLEKALYVARNNLEFMIEEIYETVYNLSCDYIDYE